MTPDILAEDVRQIVLAFRHLAALAQPKREEEADAS